MEVDEYESFWEPALTDVGYASVWYKRPRSCSPDGCCVAYRPSAWALEASRGFWYDDDGTQDRGALIALLRKRDVGAAPRGRFHVSSTVVVSDQTCRTKASPYETLKRDAHRSKH